MPRITFISADNSERVVEATCGRSAMEAAVQNLVRGIDADCGGQAACGTCHVWVDAAWIGRTGRATPGIETDMLACTDSATDRSRLSCQIRISEDLDGLVLRMPQDQH